MKRIEFGIPKRITVPRDGKDEPAVSIIQFTGDDQITMGVGKDGGYTLRELEDLEWRIKQGKQLLIYGKIRHQHA